MDRNLFLALAIFVGIFLKNQTPIVYGLLSIIAAGVVLVISKRKLWRAALIHIVPALTALIVLCL